MPAKSLNRITQSGTYCHIYNCGIEKKILFNDDQDYQTFIEYLKEYLTPPLDAETAKKSFIVKGQEFRGTPHQPKNYFNRVELIAYSLKDEHFHLILHQIVDNSLESFIRSLCTRYSIYFNKKYHRTGSLFSGPYKSVALTDMSQMTMLSNYINHEPNKYSSALEYHGQKETSWVKTGTILKYLEEQKTTYQAFNEKNKNKQEESIKNIKIENNETVKRLERSILTRENIQNPETSEEKNSFKEINYSDKDEVSFTTKIGEILVLNIVFLILITIGVKNINANNQKIKIYTAAEINKSVPTPTASTLNNRDSQNDTTSFVLNNINDDHHLTTFIKVTSSVTVPVVFNEPAFYSEKIGEISEGDQIEILPFDTDWNKVRLANGKVGFIESKYINIEQYKNE